MLDPSRKDQLHLGGKEASSSQMANLGHISYPKYNYDDRFTDIEIGKFTELF